MFQPVPLPSSPDMVGAAAATIHTSRSCQPRHRRVHPPPDPPARRAPGAALPGHRRGGARHRRDHPGDRPGRWRGAGGVGAAGAWSGRSRQPAGATSTCRSTPRTRWRSGAMPRGWRRSSGAEHVAIVHARSRAPAWSAWLACRRTGAHFVTTYHGTYSEGLPFKRRYNSVMARGEIVIAASRFIADLITARHGVDAGPHPDHSARRRSDAFRPDAVSADRWPAGARLAAAGRRADADAAGAADRVEGPRGADRGAGPAAAARRDRGARRLRPGTASLHRRAWCARRTRLGVADRLRLVGDCDDMPAALALSDVVVHASTQAGGVRPRGDRGAGDGAPGDRRGPWRSGRDGGARGHRLARAARRPGRAGGGDRRGAGAVGRTAARWVRRRARRCCAATPCAQCRRRRWTFTRR